MKSYIEPKMNIKRFSAAHILAASEAGTTAFKDWADAKNAKTTDISLNDMTMLNALW